MTTTDRRLESLAAARREIYHRVVAGEVDPNRATARLFALEMEATGRRPAGPSTRRSGRRAACAPGRGAA